MDLGITDLKVTPEAVPPLPMLKTQVTLMQNYIVQQLVQAGAGPDGILQIYSADRVIWELPSAYGADSPKGCASPSCSLGATRREEYVLDVYKRMLSRVGREGMTQKTREFIAEHIGPVCNHPYIFSPSSQGPESVAIAAAEYALLFAERSAQSNFHKGYAFIKLKARSFSSRMGVIDGKVVGSSAIIDPGLLELRLCGERGMVAYASYDVYDQIRAWSDDNYFALPNPTVFRRVLAFLKMNQNGAAAYEMSQRLHHMPTSLVSDVTLKAATYTDDALDELRAIWFEGADSDEDRYRRLYNSLVPRFIDAAQFLTMFKVDPQDILQTKEIESINSGMETFIDHYLSVQLAARNGRVVI